MYQSLYIFINKQTLDLIVKLKHRISSFKVFSSKDFTNKAICILVTSEKRNDATLSFSEPP